MTGDLQQLFEGPSYRAKDKQKAKLFHAICSSTGLTRKQLADQLTLRRTTVSHLVQQLLEDDLVREGKLRSNGRQGRPQIPLYPNFNRFTALALYFVSMELKGALLNSAYQVLAERSVTLSEQSDHAQLANRIVETAHELQQQVPAGSELLGCGITFPGYVDTYRRRWLFAARWPGLREFSATQIEPRLNLPLAFRRSLDAELDYLLGRYPEYRTGGTLLVHWGYGIGSSYAHDARIVQTTAGGFGEIGHVALCERPEAARCICGRTGCLETEAALWAVLPRLRESVPDLPHGEEEFSRAFLERNLAGHPQVKRAVDAFTRAMVVLYTLFAPERMVMYGPFIDSDEIYRTVTSSVHRALPEDSAELLTIERIRTTFAGDLFGATSGYFRDAYTRYLLAR